MYLVHIDGYVNHDVDEVPQRQTGDEGVRPVAHTLVLVYNPQQGGVAHQAHHKHYGGDEGVDVLEVGLNGRSHDAHGRGHQHLHHGSINRVRSQVVGPGGAGADGAAVERRGLEGAVDERAQGRVHLCFGSVYLAHSPGCHAGH